MLCLLLQKVNFGVLQLEKSSFSRVLSLVKSSTGSFLLQMQLSIWIFVKHVRLLWDTQIASRFAVFSNMDIAIELRAFRARLDWVLICVLFSRLLMSWPLFDRRERLLLRRLAALCQTEIVIIWAALNCTQLFCNRCWYIRSLLFANFATKLRIATHIRILRLLSLRRHSQPNLGLVHLPSALLLVRGILTLLLLQVILIVNTILQGLMLLVRMRSLHRIKRTCPVDHSILVPLLVSKDFFHNLLLVLVSNWRLEGVLYLRSTLRHFSSFTFRLLCWRFRNATLTIVSWKWWSFFANRSESWPTLGSFIV